MEGKKEWREEGKERETDRWSMGEATFLLQALVSTSEIKVLTSWDCYNTPQVLNKQKPSSSNPL